MERIIRCPQTEQEWELYYDLRYRILREPWQQPRGSERNEGDATALHFALFEGEKMLGVGRLDQQSEGVSQIRFMAVENEHQGKSIGKELMLNMEQIALERGDHLVVLHAREIALDFYKKLGYSLIEKSHNLFGQIQHYLMEKKIGE